MLVFLTGCWDRIEINDLALVLASGADLTKDGHLKVTLQIALPSAMSKSSQDGGGAQKPVMVVSATGEDVLDAIHHIQEQLSRRIFLGHRGVLVIGESLAKQGLINSLDELSRSPQSRMQCYILTTHGETAENILNTPYPLEKVPAVGMSELENSGIGEAVTVDKFLTRNSEGAIQPVTGVIHLTKNSDGNKIYRLAEAAVYHNYKLKGYLSEEEARGYLWVIGKVKKADITSPIPHVSGKVSVQLLQAHTKIQTRFHGEMPEITVFIQAKGDLLENNTNLDLSNLDHLKQAQSAISHDIEERVRKTVVKAQKKLHSDIFGFGQEIHIQHDGEWKKIKNNWERIYPEIPVKIEVKARIIRIGRTQAPEHLQKDKIKK